MIDQKAINRLKLMLGHATRTLDMAEPDLRIVEKLLSDALDLVVQLNEPPNPYADKALRPGLRVGEPPANDRVTPIPPEPPDV